VLPRITEITLAGGHQLTLSFSDGVQATVDFRPLVFGRGGMLAALEDEAFFSQVRVDSEAGTVVWPNNVDFDPDVLYGMATGIGALPGIAAVER
jgi:hypothetical protein